MGTQWPIAPGESFTYRTWINNEPGTYWYHAHYQLQSHSVFGSCVLYFMLQGVNHDFCNIGPLIIQDGPQKPFVYDEEIILSLSDWYVATYFDFIGLTYTLHPIGIMPQIMNKMQASCCLNLALNGLAILSRCSSMEKGAMTVNLHCIHPLRYVLVPYWIQMEPGLFLQ